MRANFEQHVRLLWTDDMLHHIHKGDNVCTKINKMPSLDIDIVTSCSIVFISIDIRQCCVVLPLNLIHTVASSIKYFETKVMVKICRIAMP